MFNYKRGDYLQKLLDKNDMTQKALSEQTDINRSTINKHINNQTAFRIEEYFKLSNTLDVSIDSLYYGGKKRETKLKKFVRKPIDSMKLDRIPKQPDSLGKTVLDYVIELNDVEKYIFFYENKVYIECLHNNAKLLAFLIRNNQYDLLSKDFESNVFDQVMKTTHEVKGKPAEFPVIDYSQGVGSGSTRRYHVPYQVLSHEQRTVMDAILDTKSNEILDLLPYESSGIYNAPIHFDLAIDRNKKFIVEYYVKKNKLVITQDLFDSAINEKSWTVAKYFFENMKDRTLENLKQIKDTKYKKKWKEIIVNT